MDLSITMRMRSCTCVNALVYTFQNKLLLIFFLEFTLILMKNELIRTFSQSLHSCVNTVLYIVGLVKISENSAHPHALEWENACTYHNQFLTSSNGEILVFYRMCRFGFCVQPGWPWFHFERTISFHRLETFDEIEDLLLHLQPFARSNLRGAIFRKFGQL